MPILLFVFHVTDFYFTSQEKELNEMLHLAIKHKQISFIQNMIERNANIKTFLTVERFESILRENTPKNTLFHALMMKKCGDRDNWSFDHFAMVGYVTQLYVYFIKLLSIGSLVLRPRTSIQFCF